LHQDKFKTCRGIEQRDFPRGAPLSREACIHHMIVEEGIFYEEGSIEWSQ